MRVRGVSLYISSLTLRVTLSKTPGNPAASARELFLFHCGFEALADAAGYKVIARGLMSPRSERHWATAGK